MAMLTLVRDLVISVLYLQSIQTVLALILSACIPLLSLDVMPLRVSAVHVCKPALCRRVMIP